MCGNELSCCNLLEYNNYLNIDFLIRKSYWLIFLFIEFGKIVLRRHFFFQNSFTNGDRCGGMYLRKYSNTQVRRVKICKYHYVGWNENDLSLIISFYRDEIGF